LNQVEIKSTYN